MKMKNKLYDDFGHEIEIGMPIGFNKTIKGIKFFIYGKVTEITDERVTIKRMNAHYTSDIHLSDKEIAEFKKKVKESYSIKRTSKFWLVDLNPSKK